MFELGALSSALTDGEREEVGEKRRQSCDLAGAPRTKTASVDAQRYLLRG